MLSEKDCADLASQLSAGKQPSIDPYATWVGSGEDVPLKPIAEAAIEISKGMLEWTDKDRDRFEGKAAPTIFAALTDVRTEVLDDRGFWRFLSLRFFWDFIAWREEEPFSKGNHLKYVSATTNTESVLPRMYLRAQAVGGVHYAGLAAALPKGTDFWRSHVLRVRTGSAPALTRAFAAKQAGSRLSTDLLRDAARRLNRTWTNVVLHLYNDDEASDLIDTIWNEETE